MKETYLAFALCGLSFAMAVIWGGPLIKIMHYFKIGKIIREEGPTRHTKKLGTPTMGGFMIIVPVTIITVLLNAASLLGFNLLGFSILLPLLVMIFYGILGAIDDWEGVRGSRKGLGMRPGTKFLIQVILATIAAFFLKYELHVPEMYWFGYPEPFSLGFVYIPLSVFIIVGTSNAMNFTDGLDGLAGLISVTAFAGYGAIALLQNQIFLARFCFTIVGALFGFLWFNVYPAELFMGDAGSLSLGATLAVLALMTGQWLILPLIAIIPVSEVLSVILQVAYFKLTGGRRLFRMSPLHHHFELLGWSETQVVQRFWLIGLLSTMIGTSLIFIK